VYQLSSEIEKQSTSGSLALWLVPAAVGGSVIGVLGWLSGTSIRGVMGVLIVPVAGLILGALIVLSHSLAMRSVIKWSVWWVLAIGSGWAIGWVGGWVAGWLLFDVMHNAGGVFGQILVSAIVGTLLGMALLFLAVRTRLGDPETQ
jgi:hypothetical protein